MKVLHCILITCAICFLCIITWRDICSVIYSVISRYIAIYQYTEIKLRYCPKSAYIGPWRAFAYIAIYISIYSWDSEPSTWYRHEMQFIHWNGRCGTLTFRQRDLSPPLNAPGSCASTDTAHSPIMSRNRSWRRIYDAVSLIWESSHVANFAICALATDRTQVVDVLGRSQHNSLHIITLTSCISLLSSLVEHRKGDDPAMIQHLENTLHTLWSPLRLKKVRKCHKYIWYA